MTITNLERRYESDGKVISTIRIDEEIDFINCSSCGEISFSCTQLPRLGFYVCVKCMSEFFDKDELIIQKFKIFVARKKIQRNK